MRIHGASRTDAGVHALGQVASFATSTRLDAPVLRRALNAVLPEDVSVVDCEQVHRAWGELAKPLPSPAPKYHTPQLVDELTDLAQSLLGHAAGDEVNFETDGGTKRYRIETIEAHQPVPQVQPAG